MGNKGRKRTSGKRKYTVGNTTKANKHDRQSTKKAAKNINLIQYIQAWKQQTRKRKEDHTEETQKPKKGKTGRNDSNKAGTAQHPKKRTHKHKNRRKPEGMPKQNINIQRYGEKTEKSH